MNGVKPEPDCIYGVLVRLESNDLSFASESIGKLWIQSCFVLHGSVILFFIEWGETGIWLYLQFTCSLGIKCLVFCFQVDREIVNPFMFCLEGKCNAISYWNRNLIVFAVSRFVWNQMTCSLLPSRSGDCESNWVGPCRMQGSTSLVQQITWIPV